MCGDQSTSHDAVEPSDSTPEASFPRLESGVGGDDSMIHSADPRVVSFNEIAGGTAEVIIEHEGQKYRLRSTRNGRLLLNK